MFFTEKVRTGLEETLSMVEDERHPSQGEDFLRVGT
jgi:hypothetical protein